jgi:DNA-binding transcriptional LysR family regulator
MSFICESAVESGPIPINNAWQCHQLYAYMNVDEIEAFLCVAELGNFSKASLQLHRTQPAISRRISILEQSLKTVLFERTARSARLTAAGRAFLPHAQAVRAALRDGARAVRDVEQRTQPPQPFSLAVVGTLADAHLVAALRKLEASLPGTSVALTTATSREVSELVKSGEAELGLRYFADADPLLTCEPLSTERLHLVVSKNHPAPRRLPDLRTLAGEQWLGFPKDRNHPESYGHLLERELLACGIAAPRITSVDSLTAQKRLVQAGLGITLMPLSSCREELQVGSMRAVEVTGLRAELPVTLVRRREGYTSRAAEGFLQILHQQPRSTPPEMVTGRRRTLRKPARHR